MEIPKHVTEFAGQVDELSDAVFAMDGNAGGMAERLDGITDVMAGQSPEFRAAVKWLASALLIRLGSLRRRMLAMASAISRLEKVLES